MADPLILILAGGRGERLSPLTEDRCKPAVPFGGRYRIIDFVLSNMVNSGFYRIKVITQFMADSLIVHLSRGWNLGGMPNSFVEPLPAQMRTGDEWYLGTADAVYQNLDVIRTLAPSHIGIFGGDHIYKMDVRKMYDAHVESDADLTVAAIAYPRESSAQLGVVEAGPHGHIIGFQEKPAHPAEIPGRPGWSYVSMGNYFFKSEVLERVLRADHEVVGSKHEFGNNVVPEMIQDGYRVMAYDFKCNRISGEGSEAALYWRDVGTVDAYFDANMDLRSVSPAFNLYNLEWPIRTHHRFSPPAKFVFSEKGGRCGRAIDSIVSNGVIISGGTVQDSVLGTDVIVRSYAYVRDSILFDRVEIGRSARVRRAILDKFVKVEAGAKIGYDEDLDRKRFLMSPNGTIVVPKQATVHADGSVDYPKVDSSLL